MKKIFKYTFIFFSCIVILLGINNSNYVKADYCVYLSENQCHQYIDSIDRDASQSGKVSTLLGFIPIPYVYLTVGAAALSNASDRVYNNCKWAIRNHKRLGICIGDIEYYPGPPYNMAYIPMSFYQF